MKFKLSTLFLAVLVVACAAMAWRTWYLETRHPPIPKFADQQAWFWENLSPWAEDAETGKRVHLTSRYLIGVPGNYRWRYTIEFDNGDTSTRSESELRELVNVAPPSNEGIYWVRKATIQHYDTLDEAMTAARKDSTP